MSSPASSTRSAFVTAVLVVHDGDRWLPHLLQALRDSDRRPDVVVAVVTRSSESSIDVLNADEAILIVEADLTTGFGDAVRLGLEAADRHREEALGQEAEWVWLLHDDCAPAPKALTALVAAGGDAGVAVVGAKIRGWPRAQRLLEVGVTITGTGHRETGLEPAEQDQGQHDDLRRVLAVSSAGMLVRRSTWDELGGFDPSLPLFRDDVDFGWRVTNSGAKVVVAPSAVVFHAEAATRGARKIASATSSPHRGDREGALYTLLVNTSAPMLPLHYLRLCLVTVLRSIGYLLAKLPRAASDELLALFTVSAHPGRIHAGRKQRRHTAQTDPDQVRALRPPWYTPYLNGVELAMAAASGLRRSAPGMSASAQRLRAGRAELAARGSALDADSDDAVFSEAAVEDIGVGPIAWLRRHPGIGLVALLAVFSVVWSRGLAGAGLLQGGALLPAPEAASDWWSRYTESQHLVGLGTDLVTSPAVALLGLIGSVLADKAWLAVDLLLLGAPALAAGGAYLAARRVIRSVPVQVWAVTSYALLPVVTGATTTGHIGTVVGIIVLPWVVRAVMSMLDIARGPTWQSTFAGSLALSVLVAFVPVAWPVALALLSIATPALVLRRQRSACVHVALGVALPVLLLGPWSYRLLSTPTMFLTELGIPDPAIRPVADVAWQLPLGRLDATGAAPWWVSMGIALGALAALLRQDRRSSVAAAWVVIAVALSAAWILSYQSVELPGGSGKGFVWLGFPVAVAQGGAIAAVALGADGLFGVVRARSIGIRTLASVLAAVAVFAPIAGICWELWHAPHGELERSTVTALPAYMADGIEASDSRALIISGTPASTGYQVVTGPGLRLGDDTVLVTAQESGLSQLVADTLSSADADDAQRLADKGFRYVVLPAPANTGFVATLDALPGLRRASTDTTELAGWQVTVAPTKGLLGIESTGPGVPTFLAEHRSWWLSAQLLLWLVALAFAAPPLVPSTELAEGQR